MTKSEQSGMNITIPTAASITDSAITVLHLCPPNAPLLSQYISLISDALVPYNIICISTDDVKEAGRMISERTPNIVHLHGMDAPRLPKSCRIVVSPHGVDTHVAKAYVAIARSAIERKRIEKVYLRTEVIRNPIITRLVTAAETAEELCRVYRTVMDSNVLELMNDDTRVMLRTLLKVGIAGDKRWAPQPLPLQPNWRQIVIYAYREGVLDTVHKGMKLIGADASQRLETSSTDIIPEDIPAYLPKNFETPKLLKADNIMELTQHSYEEAAFNLLTLKRIVELQHMLMNHDVDEGKLVKELEEKKQTKFFCRLLHIASEMTLLDEGYMPLPPLNDRQTQQLAKTIMKRQEI